LACASNTEQTDPKLDNPELSGKQGDYSVLCMLPIIFGVPQSLVFLLFWNWFVKPLGLPGLRYWQAFGLMLFISFIRYQERKTEGNSKDDDDKWFVPIRRQYGYYFMFLFMGWIAHLIINRGA